MNPIETLKEHNEWRRGTDIEMLNPTELGKTIDTVIADYEAMQKQNNELRAKVAKYESVLCQTCHGAGTVLVGVDDGRDCPECAQSLADIRADGIRGILEKADYFHHLELDDGDVSGHFISAEDIDNYADEVGRGDE